MKNKFSNFVLKNIHKIKISLNRTNEGGILIRYMRMKKYRKKGRKLLFFTQVIAIWYITVFTANYLTSDTGAAFNDVEVIKNKLHVKWDLPESDVDTWDNSSLDMNGSQVSADGCSIYVTIKNDGDEANSISTWRYFVYKLDGNGDPSGEPVNTGIVPVIESGQPGEIESNVLENGEYKLRVRRPLGHKGNNQPDENGYSYLGWSDVIEVNGCQEDQEDEGNPEDVGNSDNDSKPPSEVTNISGVMSETSIVLTWTNPIDEDFSHVRIYKNQVGTPLVEELTSNKYEDVVEPGNYLYRITSVDISGNESQGSIITIVKEDRNVKEFSVKVKGSSGKIDLSWKYPSSELFSHIILYRNDQEILNGEYTELKNDMPPKGNHVYKIVAVYQDGTVSEGISKEIEIK